MLFWFLYFYLIALIELLLILSQADQPDIQNLKYGSVETIYRPIPLHFC